MANLPDLCGERAVVFYAVMGHGRALQGQFARTSALHMRFLRRPSPPPTMQIFELLYSAVKFIISCRECALP